MQQDRKLPWLWIAAINCLLAIVFLAYGSWQASQRASTQSFHPFTVNQVVERFGAVQAQRASAKGPDIASQPTGTIKSGNTSGNTPGQKRTDSARPGRFDLGTYPAPHQVIRIEPPVADRIVLDPSLAETPSLPSLDPEVVEPPTASVDRAVGPQAVPVTQAPATLARRPAQWTADVASVWPWPSQLVSELEALRLAQGATAWVDAVMHELNELHTIDSFDDRSSEKHLDALQSLEQQAVSMATGIVDTNGRARLLRAAYGLQRRLAVWRPIQQLSLPPVIPVSTYRDDSLDVSAALRLVDRKLSQVTQADLWQRYLLLEDVRAMAADPQGVASAQRSQLARKILRRMDSPSLNKQQQAFFDQEPWYSFSGALRRWVTEPVDYRSLLANIERYESAPEELAAQQLAESYQVLRWSAAPTANTLAGWINTYYRNANIRVSVTGVFVNRLLPELAESQEPVNDVLLGSRILGHSRVSTRLRVVLLPDNIRWRLGLEAHGEVASNTSTKHGPAKFYNAGRGEYSARKLLLIDHFGLRARNAEADATSDADLTRLETDFDGLPLVNVLARAIAKQQYESQSHAAKWRIRDMIAARARAKLDEQVAQQLALLREKYETRVHQPLVQLGLEPEAVDMQTTEQRLIARYRLAGEHQLAAFTPRPQAPSEALLSVQIHESALNNTVAVLKLGEQSRDLRQLFAEVAQKFHVPNYQVPDDVPTDVTIRMAAVEPVRFRFDDDRIQICLRIAHLTADRRHWRNFEVRATYAPQAEGLHTQLVRDGYIKLKGYRLSFGDQIALRGVFSKVLPKNPDVDILGRTLGTDTRLQHVSVSQFVMRDGWIGVALSGDGTAHVHLADRPGPVDR